MPSLLAEAPGHERMDDAQFGRVRIHSSRRGGEGSEMVVTSRLSISDVTPGDAGNYSCLPSNLHGALNVLHVVTGEHRDSKKG